MTTPFAPMGATMKIAATTTSQSSALTPGNSGVRVYNASTSIAFVRFTGLASTALTTDLPIPAGAVETFDIGGGCGFASVILASGTGDVYFTSGRGL